MKDTGWDSYYESLSLLEDLKQLQTIELPPDRFPAPEHTKARLALISYCHITEMNLPYELLANLIRLRIGRKYATSPFAHLGRPLIKNKVLQKIFPPSPEKKITEIETLSAEAGIPEIGIALRGIYDPAIRNAVYHSDYVIHEGSMRLLSDLRSRQRKARAPASSRSTNWLRLPTRLSHFIQPCLRSISDLVVRL